jgi:glycosyltransferase involved in cell wall biosynthesis
MKILQITSSYYPAILDGGPIKSIHGLCKSLVKLGHEVLVLTTNIEGRGTVMRVPLKEVVMMDGVGVIYFPSTWLKRFAHSPDMKKYIQENIDQFDIVHIHGAYQFPIYYASRFSLKNNIPYVLTPRGMLMKNVISGKNKILKKIWIALLDKKVIKKSSTVHVTSSIEFNDIVDIFNVQSELITNIPNGLEVPDAPYENNRLTPNVDYALFLGRLNWKKGLEKLLGAWSDVERYHLFIVGNDEDGYQKYLERIVIDLNLANRVHFIGHVEGEKWKIYSDAKLFILPSYAENFGNVILEAMAMGCPVLTTKETGASEIVKRYDAGVVVDACISKKNLARVINETLDNKKMLKTMGGNGRTVLKNYSWDIIAKKMINAYEEIKK